MVTALIATQGLSTPPCYTRLVSPPYHTCGVIQPQTLIATRLSPHRDASKLSMACSLYVCIEALTTTYNHCLSWPYWKKPQCCFTLKQKELQRTYFITMIQRYNQFLNPHGLQNHKGSKCVCACVHSQGMCF